MKTLFKNYFTAVLVLAFVFIASCNRNKDPEEVPQEKECLKIEIADGRLQSPEWMVQLFDSLENIAVERPGYFIYHVSYFEYQQDTYINVDELTRGYFDFHSCTGKTIGVDATENSLWWNLNDAARDKQKLFRVEFCYSPAATCNGTTVFEYFSP